MPVFPALNTYFWPPSATKMRSKTSSRSRLSPGACAKYHLSLPVSASIASVADAHPGLGLCGAPIGKVEIGIVTAGDPAFGAGAEQIRQGTPGVAALLSL